MRNVTPMLMLSGALMAACTGCSSVNRRILEATPEMGISETFPSTPDDAFYAAILVCVDRGFRIVAIDEANHTARMSGSRYYTSPIFGSKKEEHVAIFVTSVGSDASRITLVSIDDKGNPPKYDWANKILEEIRLAVGPPTRMSPPEGT